MCLFQVLERDGDDISCVAVDDIIPFGRGVGKFECTLVGMSSKIGGGGGVAFTND